jgi:hypothetical protein
MRGLLKMLDRNAEMADAQRSPRGTLASDPRAVLGPARKVHKTVKSAIVPFTKRLLA